MTPDTLLARLVDAPDAVRAVRALPPSVFSGVIRQIGVEDAGEIVALATTEQLVAAFDEDLFVNRRAGEREELDGARFAVWLEVLLEAGDAVAAHRVAALSEDFVTHALSKLVLVLDHEALRLRMSGGGEEVERADKALESALCEEIHGYLLVARRQEGWDAVLSLILALDRDRRAYLERVLDLCAAMAREAGNEVDALLTVLSSEEALAEDVEGERDERRGRAGYVEARAARGFLALARLPLGEQGPPGRRDPITSDYFRGLEAPAGVAEEMATLRPGLLGLLKAGGVDGGPEPKPGPGTRASSSAPESAPELAEALRVMSGTEPERFAQRMAELAFLANVLVAGGEREGERLRAGEAVEAALMTVAFGAELRARERSRKPERSASRATVEELVEVVRGTEADMLFRAASSALAAGGGAPGACGFLRSREDLNDAIDRLTDLPTGRRREAATLAWGPGAGRRG